MNDNKAARRFELEIEGQTVFANYRQQDTTFYIDHVEAPAALRGKGAAGQLMQAIMDKAETEGLNIVPICSYAASWLQRHKL